MSAAELAEVLVEYLNNENLYNQLLDWKNEGLASGFLKKMEVVREHFVLRLLNKLKEKGWWT